MNRTIPILMAAAALALGAQDPSREAPKPAPQGPSPVAPVPQPGADQARDEMIELFHKVERRLKEIDELLYRAGSGEAGIESQPESGIAELLQRSRDGGKEVLGGIDRILEIAKQQGGT